MKVRLLALGAAMALAGASLLGGLVAPTPASGADTDLIGWTAQADANIFQMVIDNGAGLAGSHPLSEIDVPENFSSFQTGPLGYSLATVVWPGTLVGNFGSLAGELGLPSQLAPIASKLNDPFKAAAFYPAGPSDSTFPSGAPSTGGLEMKSHTDASGSWAKAGLADITVPKLLDLQGVQGSTTATAKSVAQTTASGSFHSLSLLGGLIAVGASASTASAHSDGNSPDGTATTHIGALSIGGQQVRVGSDGIVAGPASIGSSGVLSTPTALVNQVVSLLDLKVTPLPQTEVKKAPEEQIASGGLEIKFTLPAHVNPHVKCPTLPSQLAQLSVLCTLPDLLKGLNITMTIGRVTATAIAAPPFALSLGDTGPGLPSVAAAGISAPGSAGTPADLGVPSLSSGGTAGSPSAGGSEPGEAIGRASPISLSSPIGLGLLITALVIAVAAGLGLRRVTGMLGAPAAEHCPLEDAP